MVGAVGPGMTTMLSGPSITSAIRAVLHPSRPVAASATRYPQQDVKVHGLRLRYVDVQPKVERDAPLLLIHGHASRIEEYEALIPYLAQTRRVLIPDLPGCGYSEKPDDVRYTLSFLEDSLLGFLDSQHVTRAHVAGGSMGGNLALRLAHREPERFARAAAWAPAGVWEHKLAIALGAALARWLKVPFWPVVWIQSRFWFSRHWPQRDAMLADVWSYYREVYDEGFRRSYFDLTLDQSVSSLFDRAARIRQPVYLAVGDRDHALGLRKGVERLAKIIPRARLRLFGASHSLASEVPAALGREVDAFLSES